MTSPNSKVLATNNKVYLHGPAGVGKTTLASQRLVSLLNHGVGSSEGVLVLISRQTLAEPYRKVLSVTKTAMHREVVILTMSSLVRRMVALFWPLIAYESGFHKPFDPPSFLTLETSQYYMGRLVDPLIAQGYFSTVSLTRNRLLGQLIDNLNKSAIVGFPHSEIGERLRDAWVGQDAQRRVYEDAQLAVNQFRAFCLQNNLLDYSLQVELFKNLLWPNELCRNYLRRQFAHLIYDNPEEDPPYVHDILLEWISDFKSALIVQDDLAGYHSFLGADPQSAIRFREQAEEIVYLADSDVNHNLRNEIMNNLLNIQEPVKLKSEEIRSFIEQPTNRIRFYPDLLKNVAGSITEKVQAGVAPNEIVILSPFLSDSTVFTLEHELAKSGIKLRASRPSTSLKDDPVIQTMLTFAILAHPEWMMALDPYRLSSVFSYAMPGLDFVRSHLITKQISSELPLRLPKLEELPEEILTRLTEEQTQKWSQMVEWILQNQSIYPLDLFFSRLFGELLSQEDYSFHDNLESGSTSARLIDSFRKFRDSFGYQMNIDHQEMAKEFVKSVLSGVLAASFLDNNKDYAKESVLITPVISFLGMNKVVDYQYWLNVGSTGWYERLEQPLTHPIVLSRHWRKGKKWTADDDLKLSRETLGKLVRGLFNRCQKGIYLGMSDFSESGMEEKGLLMLHFQSLFRRTLRSDDEA